MTAFFIRIFLFLAAGTGIIQLIRRMNQRQAQVAYPDPESLITYPDLPAIAVRNPDQSITLRWQRNASPAHIYAVSYPDFSSDGRPLRRIDAGYEAYLPGPYPPHQQFFRIHFQDDHEILVAERDIPMEGTTNFRDIGGYLTNDGHKVRWGRVYRSALLAHLTQADHNRLAQMEIQLICDLRSQDEAATDPDHLPATNPPAYLHLPPQADQSRLIRLRMLLFERHKLTALMERLYIQVMIERNAALFGAVYRRLADDRNLPALIHCAAGKDRAGLVIAVLLRLLGVAEDTVIADYSLSNRDFTFFKAMSQKAIVPLLRMGLKEEVIHPLLIADPAVMRAALSYIDTTYGSAEEYLRRRAGLDDEIIEKLRNNLLT